MNQNIKKIYKKMEKMNSSKKFNKLKILYYLFGTTSSSTSNSFFGELEIWFVNYYIRNSI